MTTSEKVSIRIEKEKKLALERLAKKLQTTSSELIRRLIENLLEITELYDYLTFDSIFSTNPLLTIGDLLKLPDEGERTWNQWVRDEVEITMSENYERNVVKHDENST